MKRARNAYLAVLAFVLAPLTAHAGIIITVGEIGDDVVFSFYGNLDTDGLTPKFYTHGHGIFNGGANANSTLFTPDTAISFGVGNSMLGYEVQSFAPTSTVNRVFFGSTAGDGFGLFSGNTLALPIGYVSQTNISGYLTLASQSFDSLGLLHGTYETYLPSQDFVRMEIGPAVRVSEPSALLLLGSGLLALLIARRRRSE